MRKFLSIIILALVAIAANAQDDFNPTLPDEPNALYKVTVGISHTAAGTVYGDGSFKTGNEVTIRRQDAGFSSSSTVYYKFKYWMLNGEEYVPAGTASSFVYTVGTEDAMFEAVYEEEDPDNVSSRIYLVAEPSDACTFNRESGTRVTEESYIYVTVYLNTGFVFKGWYVNGEKISTNQSFNYLMGSDNVTLTAMCEYSPTTPDDPSSSASQGSIQNTAVGDLDGNKQIDTADAVELIDKYVNNKK